jgi:hypothetical protein
LPEGTLFIYVFLGLAPGIALLLAWRSVRRAVREPRLKWTVLVVGAAALALWTAATYLMGLVAFGTAWGLAHTRPFPAGLFPEGWPIYGFLAAYAGVGVFLALALGRLPRRKAAV